jgi:hypothetical protein
MNNDIILYISKFLNLQEYNNLSLINKNTLKNLKSNIPTHIKTEFAINELLKAGYPRTLMYVFDPIKLYKTPIYPNKIYRGFTDYIDYINPEYFINTSIIRGRDEVNRPFISFYYNNIITTLFQRYTDNSTRWVTGGQNNFNNRVFVFDLSNMYYFDDPIIIILSELLKNNLYIHDNIIYKLNN